MKYLLLLFFVIFSSTARSQDEDVQETTSMLRFEGAYGLKLFDSSVSKPALYGHTLSGMFGGGIDQFHLHAMYSHQDHNGKLDGIEFRDVVDSIGFHASVGLNRFVQLAGRIHGGIGTEYLDDTEVANFLTYSRSVGFYGTADPYLGLGYGMFYSHDRYYYRNPGEYTDSFKIITGNSLSFNLGVQIDF